MICKTVMLPIIYNLLRMGIVIMKRKFIYLLIPSMLFVGIFSACNNYATSKISEQLSNSVLTEVPSQVDTQTWQDAYTELLRETTSKEFFLCDIDQDELPELLIGGPSTDTDKYANYDVYIFKEDTIECIGSVGTLSWSFLWLDSNKGILGYDYGAGSGGMHRYYIDNGALYNEGEVNGYYYDSEGDCIEWFRNSDGVKTIVTEKTEDEYQSIYSRYIKLECYDITEVNITKVIYGEL